jgi:acylphosphatase
VSLYLGIIDSNFLCKFTHALGFAQTREAPPDGGVTDMLVAAICFWTNIIKCTIINPCRPMRSTNLILLRALSLTMQTQIKRYNILLRGKVQHIGYRGIIEGTARKLDIKGYVFNDVDGSVKIACEGLQKSIDIFITSIKEFARSDIDTIEKKEIHEELYLPSVFSRVATDEYYEFGKKFDLGIDLLEGIKTDTGEMKGTLGEMKESLTNINTTLEAFVMKQDEHNQRLEKILEKLVER